MGADEAALERCRSELHAQKTITRQQEIDLAQSKSSLGALRTEFVTREANFRQRESDVAERSAREFGEQQGMLHSQEIQEIDREYTSLNKAYQGARAELQESGIEKNELLETVQGLREETNRLSGLLKHEQQSVFNIERSVRSHMELIDHEAGELHRSKEALTNPCG